jgi:putative membrane protein
MKRHVSVLTAFVFAAATALTAQAQSQAPRPQPDKPSTGANAPGHEQHAQVKGAGSDQEFARKVAAGGHAEVELAMLAQQKGSSEEVKNLASRLRTDHMKANDELTKIASQKNWTLPAEPTADQKNQKAKLEKLSGTAFDKAYADLMVTNHRNNIPLFERQAAKGADAELKQFASNTLPTLKEHLEMALKAQRAVGAATSTAHK